MGVVVFATCVRSLWLRPPRLSCSVQPLSPLNIELVGHHSLWAHELWNAGVVMGRYCDENPALCSGKNILELGAAAAVPSLIAALQGASQVCLK